MSFCDIFNQIVLSIAWVCRGSMPSFGRLGSWEINEQTMSLYFSVFVKTQLVKAIASLSPWGQGWVTPLQSLWSGLCLLHGFSWSSPQFTGALAVSGVSEALAGPACRACREVLRRRVATCGNDGESFVLTEMIDGALRHLGAVALKLYISCWCYISCLFCQCQAKAVGRCCSFLSTAPLCCPQH